MGFGDGKASSLGSMYPCPEMPTLPEKEVIGPHSGGNMERLTEGRWNCSLWKTEQRKLLPLFFFSSFSFSICQVPYNMSFLTSGKCSPLIFILYVNHKIFISK